MGTMMIALDVYTLCIQHKQNLAILAHHVTTTNTPKDCN